MLKQFKKKNHKTYYWPSLNRSERTEALHQKGQCSFARTKKQNKKPTAFSYFFSSNVQNQTSLNFSLSYIHIIT